MRPSFPCHLLALLALGPWLCHAQINRAVASIRGASGFYSAVTGSVTFEQAADDPLADITVRVSVSGLQPGQHGFHVHQYGDVRDTATLSTIGYHFVPFCIPPDVIVDEDGNIIETPDGCADDQVHGLPPDSKRQPGDMGNLVIGADGSPDAASGTLTIGQGKMSLTDPLRSIIGRTVIVHQFVDDGGQPYGNAGNPEAYGVIGIASTAVGATNGAQAPEVPRVTKIMCEFEAPAGPLESTIDGVPASSASVVGSVLLSLLEPNEPGVVRFQARLAGLNADSEHSFHFHEWGDMTVGMNSGLLGPIYSANQIAVHSVHVNAQGYGLIDLRFASETLGEHVGRSITIHSGPDASSSTIAAATCGMGNPKAYLDTAGAHTGESPPISAGVIAVVVISFVVIFGLGFVGVLYYLRYPIPCIGKMLYEKEFVGITTIPPPPPPPVSGQTGTLTSTPV